MNQSGSVPASSSPPSGTASGSVHATADHSNERPHAGRMEHSYASSQSVDGSSTCASALSSSSLLRTTSRCKRPRHASSRCSDDSDQPAKKRAGTSSPHVALVIAATPYPLQDDFFAHFLQPNHWERLPNLRRYHQPTTLPILDMLSDDLVGNCLFSGYLDTFETMRLTQVSKRLRSVSRHCTKSLDLHCLSRISPGQLAGLVANFPCLESLDFSYCTTFGAEHLHVLTALAPSLKRLLLKGTKVQDEDLISFLDRCHGHINHHGQQQQQRQQSQGSTLACLQLEELDLSATSAAQTYNIGNATLRHLAVSCPRLRRLRLGWCKQVTDEGIHHLTSLRHLIELDLSLTNVSDLSCVNVLSGMPRLQQLDLSATQVTKAGIDAVLREDKPRLRQLRLRHLPSLCVMSLLSQIQKNAPQLRLLDVTFSIDPDYEYSQEELSSLKEDASSLLRTRANFQLCGFQNILVLPQPSCGNDQKSNGTD